MKTRFHRNRRSQGGFTLIELLVVIVILGSLVAIVAPQVLGQADEADQDLTRIEIQKLMDDVELWRIRYGNRQIPDSLDVLTEAPSPDKMPIRDELPQDPWGNDYELIPGEGRRYVIRSWGFDGTPDTEDDIRSDDSRRNDRR